MPNNIPVPQQQPTFNQLPLNLNIQNQQIFGGLNLMQQLNQPSTSQLLAQYHMQKLAEAMQRTQNANFLLPNQNSGLFPGLGTTAPQNPLLMTQNAFRTPVIVNVRSGESFVTKSSVFREVRTLPSLYCLSRT